MLRRNKPLACCIVLLAISIIAHAVIFANLPDLFSTLYPRIELLQMEQTMILDAQKENGIEGRIGLPWGLGIMELSISSVDIYNTLEETGITDKEDIKWQQMQQNTQPQEAFMVIRINLKNINAQQDLSPKPNRIVDTERPPYEFLINFLTLDWADHICTDQNKFTDPYYERFNPWPVYFSGHPHYSDADEQMRNYFRFELAPGEQDTYTLIYTGDEEALRDIKRVLNVGVTPSKKAAFYLHKSEGGVGT